MHRFNATLRLVTAETSLNENKMLLVDALPRLVKRHLHLNEDETHHFTTPHRLNEDKMRLNAIGLFGLLSFKRI